jgi:putative membrane protein
MRGMNLLARLFVNAVALAVAAWLLAGITITGDSDRDRVITLIVVAAIFGLVNAIVRPVVKLLTLPFIILTLGLLVFVINACMLLLTSWITDQLDVQFHVDGFGTALLGALIITAVGWVLDLLLPDSVAS